MNYSLSFLNFHKTPNTKYESNINFLRTFKTLRTENIFPNLCLSWHGPCYASPSICRWLRELLDGFFKTLLLNLRPEVFTAGSCVANFLFFSLLCLLIFFIACCCWWFTIFFIVIGFWDIWIALGLLYFVVFVIFVFFFCWSCFYLNKYTKLYAKIFL